MNELKINKNISILIFFSILILITFFPLLKVGFTTADDAFDHYLNINNPKVNILNEAKGIAQSQARFQYFFVYLLSLFPYIFIKNNLDNLLIFRLISLSQILLNFILFSSLTFKITNSKIFSLLVFIFLISFIQNSWQHNLLTSYPFIFSFGFNLSLISLLLFIDYLKDKKKWKLIISVLLFTFSLFNYEIFILYFIFFFLITLFFLKNNNLLDRIRIALKKLFFHISFLTIFLTIYILFRKIFPGVYDGTHSFNFNIFRVIKTSLQFAISSFPTYIYKHSIGEILKFSYTYDKALLDFNYILKNIQLIWLLKGILSFYLSFIFLNNYKKIKNKTLFFLIIISIFFIFIPVLPQSFVSKYQNWVINLNQIAFTPTFFSFFGMILLIVILLSLFLNLVKNKVILVIINILISLLVFRFSVITDYSNYFYTLDQSQLFNVWQAIEKLINTHEFINIPNNSIIYAPTLYKYTTGVILKETSEYYWSTLINSKTGKNIKIINSEEKLNNISTYKSPLYYLGFSQEIKDPNLFMVLAKIKKIDSNSLRKKILSDNFLIFTLSKYKNYQIIYETNNKVKYFLVNKDLETNPLVKTQINDSNIDLYTINISHYLDALSPLKDIEYQFKEGFYNEEIDNANNFRWSDKKSKIIVFNQDHDKYVNIVFKISAGFGNSKLILSGDILNDILFIDTNPIIFQKTVYLTYGEHTINFYIDGKKLEVPGDSRNLYFKITNFEINEK